MLSEDQNKLLDKLLEYDYIRMSFCDLNGHHMTKLISRDQAKKFVENQCDIYCGIIGFGPRFEIHKHDRVIDFNLANGYLIPDAETFHPLPWLTKKRPEYLLDLSYRDEKIKFCSVLCDLQWPNRQPINEYPRTLCKILLERLEKEFQLKLYSSFEPEFTMLKEENIIETHEEKPGLKTGSIQPVHKGVELYKTWNLEKYEDFFVKVDQNLSHMGVKIQDFATENGPGQVEMPLMPEFGLKAADNYFIMKQTVKELARKEKMHVTFMSKPFEDSKTSTGCHYNHSLWSLDGSVNAFFNETDEKRLSDTCKHWIGGLLEHLPAMTALVSPTINCYRRLHRELAPDLCNWNIDDRFYSIRVKNVDHSRTYVENRSPSSAANPYFVMAATLAAGMDGLRRKIEPKYFATKDPQVVPKLPESLSKALCALTTDQVFCQEIGQEFCSWLTAVKTTGDLKSLNEIDSVPKDESQWSKELYEYLCLS